MVLFEFPFFLFSVLGIKLRPLYTVLKDSTTTLYLCQFGWFLFLRQSLTKQPRLALISQSSCLCLPCPGNMDLYYGI